MRVTCTVIGVGACVMCDVYHVHTRSGILHGLPSILEGYVPPLVMLPLFLLRLAADVSEHDMSRDV